MEYETGAGLSADYEKKTGMNKCALTEAPLLIALKHSHDGRYNLLGRKITTLRNECLSDMGRISHSMLLFSWSRLGYRDNNGQL